MSEETTNIIDMSKALKCRRNAPKFITAVRIKMLCMHARTMGMMYEATGNKEYLVRARIDLDMAHTIKIGFQRPLGVHSMKAA